MGIIPLISCKPIRQDTDTDAPALSAQQKAFTALVGSIIHVKHHQSTRFKHTMLENVKAAVFLMSWHLNVGDIYCYPSRV